MLRRGLSVTSGLIALGLVTQLGCAKPRAPVAVQTPQAARVPTQASSQEPLPELIVTEIEKEREPERVYSFTLRGADIHEVMLSISKQTSYNIVVDPDVQGTVTLDLKNVTLTDALDTLTDLLGLTYRVKRNLIRVSRPALETRIFSLGYVNLKRTANSSTTAQIGASIAGGVGGATAGATAGGGGGAGGQTTITTSSETDLWSSLEAGVTQLLSPDGKLVVDKQGGNILVTDFPRFLDRIATFLETVEGSVQRQVLIEARLIEVTLSGKFRFGIDWSAVAQAGALAGGTSSGRIFSQLLAPGDATDFQIGVTSTDFAALINILSSQGEVNVLSSPRLATLNNQTAVLRSATDDVFFVTETERTPSPSGPVLFTTVTPRTVTVGVVLSITPQISSDGSVILHVRPTVSRKSGESTISTETTTISVPILEVREADVIVRAEQGQVVVIGGLIDERQTDDEKKVPLLGDLPGVGRLFRQTIQERNKTELVVLLRPTVLVGKRADQISARDLARLKKLRGASPW